MHLIQWVRSLPAFSVTHLVLVKHERELMLDIEDKTTKIKL
jgi:hypothetical protein